MGDSRLKHYITIALIVFITFCCCILFFFLIYRYNGFTTFWRQIVGILQPITIGLVLAYLLNPVMKFCEKWILKWLLPRMKSARKARKAARGIAIACALLFLVGIFVILIAAVVPSISNSIQEIVVAFPYEVNNLIRWVDDLTKGDSEVAAMLREAIETGSRLLQNYVEQDLLPEAQTYLASITSGVIYGLRLLLNVMVGIIVSIYVMASQETFAGQAKKIIYAIFKPVRANVIIETTRKSNEIFGGFITGKLLDSLIIGILAYVVLVIMGMPDTVLLAVIIGVTNIIPFFGPFIGAVPCLIIVMLQNPLQGLYFLIFVFVLQQIDGNIIGPKILGNSTGLSSFWVVFAILMFGGLWGFPGMLLGVPVTAVLYHIIQQVVEYFLKQRGLAQDTVSYINLVRVDRETNQMIYDGAPPKKKKLSRRMREELAEEKTSGKT